MSQDEIDAFLAQRRNAVLSTLDRHGAPHAAAMWFVPAGDEVLMWTYAKSQKAVNLERDPRCSLLVEEGLAYEELRGVLIRGSARLISTYEEVLAIGKGLYGRYTGPETGNDIPEGPLTVIESQARKRIGIGLSTARLASWDHRKLGR